MLIFDIHNGVMIVECLVTTPKGCEVPITAHKNWGSLTGLTDTSLACKKQYKVKWRYSIDEILSFFI